MDNGYATLRCALKVHSGCDACTMEILGSIVGVYDITMDSERNTARISGQVDPNFCMKAIARCDGHAQVLWANLSHPRMMQSSSSYGYDSSSSSYFPEPPQVIRSLPADYPTTSYPPCTSSGINYPPPPYNYPPAPPMDYYYYGGDDYSLCSIM